MCTGIGLPVSPQGLAGLAGSCGKEESAPRHMCTYAAVTEQAEPCGSEEISEVGLERPAFTPR